MYKKAHESIRNNPKLERQQTKKVDEKKSQPKKRWNAKKLTNAERKQRVVEAKAAYLKELQGEEMES